MLAGDIVADQYDTQPQCNIVTLLNGNFVRKYLKSLTFAEYQVGGSHLSFLS